MIIVATVTSGTLQVAARRLRRSKLQREHIVPKREPSNEIPDKPLAPRTWMQRLKRVFAIATILDHIRAREAAEPSQTRPPPPRNEPPPDPSRNHRLTPTGGRNPRHRSTTTKHCYPHLRSHQYTLYPSSEGRKGPSGRQFILRHHLVSNGYSSYVPRRLALRLASSVGCGTAVDGDLATGDSPTSR